MKSGPIAVLMIKSSDDHRRIQGLCKNRGFQVYTPQLQSTFSRFFESLYRPQIKVILYMDKNAGFDSQPWQIPQSRELSRFLREKNTEGIDFCVDSVADFSHCGFQDETYHRNPSDDTICEILNKRRGVKRGTPFPTEKLLLPGYGSQSQ